MRRADDVARIIATDMGSPLGFALKVQTLMPARVLASYAGLAESHPRESRVGNSLVVKEPVGVVAAITPWNYPLHQIIAKVAPALAAGCTVVLKPSEVAPLAAYALADIFHEVGLPPGVFNLVSGRGPVVGEAMAAHPDVDMISFTGSVRAGRRVAALAAEDVKRVALELGGKSANVILPDADLGVAVKVGVANCFVNAGQTCSAWTRMLVHRDQLRRRRPPGRRRPPASTPWATRSTRAPGSGRWSPPHSATASSATSTGARRKAPGWWPAAPSGRCRAASTWSRPSSRGSSPA